MHRVRSALTCLLCLTAPASAEAPALLFPVACTLGETCFLQQFVDHDPGPAARAFDCGPQSYDGHTGTDIRVADFAAMAEGVSVTAAAPGTVRALRDGVPDGGVVAAPDGQDCGNGVVLAHSGGWETQYCHLLEGSIAVTEGQAVEAGALLGLIGYSGSTEFPHLEFVLRRDGQIVDPFDANPDPSCNHDDAITAGGWSNLWADPVPNPGGGILSAGFADAIPEFDAVQEGHAHDGRLQTDSAALVLWGFIHGGRSGDHVNLRITDAQGLEVFQQTVELERTQAQLFRAGGRRMPQAGWPLGLYRGEVRLLRDGVEIGRASTATIVTAE